MPSRNRSRPTEEKPPPLAPEDLAVNMARDYGVEVGKLVEFAMPRINEAVRINQGPESAEFRLPRQYLNYDNGRRAVEIRFIGKEVWVISENIAVIGVLEYAYSTTRHRVELKCVRGAEMLLRLVIQPPLAL